MSPSNKLPEVLDDVPLPEKLPPIVITPFVRPELLQQVLKGIRQQTLLPSEIIAFVDGARRDRDRLLIDQCIRLLDTFSTVVPVKVIARTENLGCCQNVLRGFTEVLATYDALVYLEDDDFPNRYFYDRMCRLLQAYRPYPQVFSVSAYANFPKELEGLLDTDFIVSYRVFGWGWGTWAERWHQADLLHQPPQYNPFGSFHRIPATLQTKFTMVNQFWLEKTQDSDWVITLTLVGLQRQQVHILPTTSFVRNIGFGHPEAKNYKGKEADWVNAKYDDLARPDRLPPSLEPLELIGGHLNAQQLAEHLSSQSGMWLSPTALGWFLRRYPGFEGKLQLIQMFLERLPLLLRRWVQGLSV